VLQNDPDVVMASQVILDNGYVERGGDSFSAPLPVAPAGSVIFSASLDGPPLAAREHVQILAGCETDIMCYLSNMDVSAPVTFWWQVVQLSVWLTD